MILLVHTKVTLVCDDDIRNQAQKLAENHIKHRMSQLGREILYQNDQRVEGVSIKHFCEQVWNSVPLKQCNSISRFYVICILCPVE